MRLQMAMQEPPGKAKWWCPCEWFFGPVKFQVRLYSSIVRKHVFITQCRVCRRAVLLEGEKSTTFSLQLEQGVAQGCSLSPILFLDDLLR